MIRKVLCVSAAILGLGATNVTAASAGHGPMSAVNQFIDDFNKGDTAGAKAAHVASPSIIDEVAPHNWTGPGAFDAWAKALQADAAKNGDTDEKVTLGKPTRNQIDGDTAYVVVRATFTYTEKGKAMVEPASMTYALRKQAGGWKIAAWSWNGGTPHAAPVAKPMTAAPMAKPAAPAKAAPKP